MKIAVRYQSRGGNNKEVALTIARAVNSNAETIRVPIEEPVDILFIGGGVYLGRIHPSLITFIEKLDPQNVKSVAVFSSAGGVNKTKKISAIAKNRGLPVFQKTLLVRMWLRNHAVFGGKGFVTLTEKQVRRINDFVRTVTEEKRILGSTFNNAGFFRER